MQQVEEIVDRYTYTSLTTDLLRVLGKSYFYGDLIVPMAGSGLIVTTPDGQHTYRIAVDNFGVITSELIS